MRKLLFLVSLLSFTIVSCSKEMVKINGDQEAGTKLKKIAIIELAILPPSIPSAPLLDAGVYRSGVRDIAPQILEIHKKLVGDFSNFFGDNWAKISKIEVLHSKALFDSEAYKSLSSNGIKTFPVNLKDQYFTQIVIPEGSSNFYDLSGDDQNLSSDQIKANLAQNMSAICKALNVDAVAVVTTYIETFAFRMFGNRGDRSINVVLYVYDAQGKVLFNAQSRNDSDMAGKANVEHYQSVLEQFKTVSIKMLNTLYKVPKKS